MLQSSVGAWGKWDKCSKNLLHFFFFSIISLFCVVFTVNKKNFPVVTEEKDNLMQIVKRLNMRGLLLHFTGSHSGTKYTLENGWIKMPVSDIYLGMNWKCVFNQMCHVGSKK